MTIRSLAIAGVAAIALAACDANDGPLEEAAEELDNSIEETVDAAEDAGDAVEDAADDAQ